MGEKSPSRQLPPAGARGPYTGAMETASVVAVCRVHQLLPDTSSVGVTAIDKRPAEGPVKVHRLGLQGDIQANSTLR